MKRVHVGNELTAGSLPPEDVVGDRSVLSLSAGLKRPGEEQFPSACLRCPDEPCRSFSTEAVGLWNSIKYVCPVDAIQAPASVTGPDITSACVACGLCAMRCPVGAIAVGAPATAPEPVVVPPDTTGIYEPVNPVESFLEGRARLSARIAWSGESPDDLADRLYRRAAPLFQREFYPLVASLFTTAGFPAWRPPQGDTSNRIDLLLLHQEDSIPVEVKSRTEVEVINVKAVQQALENKIVIDQRVLPRAKRDSSTLVVGYEYPPPRSDVAELVIDIRNAYDINVGLVSLRQLYVLALNRVITGRDHPWEKLSQLVGAL